MWIMTVVGRQLGISKQYVTVVISTLNAVNFSKTCSSKTKAGKLAQSESKNTPTAHIAKKISMR